MKYFVAMMFDSDECFIRTMLVHKDVDQLKAWCDSTNTVSFKWASCPGGPDPVYPGRLTPVFYSYNPVDGTEGDWEIYEAPGEVTEDEFHIR